MACFPCSLTPLDLIAVLVVKTVTVVLHQWAHSVMVLRVSAHVGQEQKVGTVTSVLRDSGTTLLLGVKVTILSYTGGIGGC